MLRLAIAFFVIAIIAAIFGFGGVAAAATDIAKILFFIFLVLFVLALLAGAVRGRLDTGGLGVDRTLRPPHFLNDLSIQRSEP